MGVRPSRVCHFARLSSVECQLVLQMLDTSSRLRAARCCRSLLRDADNPFAWPGECTFFVSFGGSHGDVNAMQLQLDSSSGSPEPLRQRSLLRHAEQLRLVCREGGGSSGASRSSSRSLSNASVVARLRAAPSDPTTDARLCQLLQHSDVSPRAKLRRVDFLTSTRLSSSLARALASLPSLTSLSLRCIDLSPLSWISTCPVLTELRLGVVLNEPWINEGPHGAPCFGRCSNSHNCEDCCSRKRICSMDASAHCSVIGA